MALSDRALKDLGIGRGEAGADHGGPGRRDDRGDRRWR
jgi:hypothetical protein